MEWQWDLTIVHMGKWGHVNPWLIEELSYDLPRKWFNAKQGTLTCLPTRIFWHFNIHILIGNMMIMIINRWILRYAVFREAHGFSYVNPIPHHAFPTARNPGLKDRALKEWDLWMGEGMVFQDRMSILRANYNIWVLIHFWSSIKMANFIDLLPNIIHM